MNVNITTEEVDSDTIRVICSGIGYPSAEIQWSPHPMDGIVNDTGTFDMYASNATSSFKLNRSICQNYTCRGTSGFDQEDINFAPCGM